MVFSYGYYGRTPGQELKPVPPSREAFDALGEQLAAASQALTDMEQARNAAIKERDTARGERNFVIGERDTARGERNTAIAERNTAVGERNTAVGERNTAIGERNTARGERNTAIGERDAARRDAVDLSTRLTNRENAYGILQANLTDVQGVLKAAVDAQIALGKERDVAKGERDTARAERNMAAGERDTARAAGADLSSRLTAKESALAALQGNLDQMRQAWQAALDAKAQAEAANATALAGAQQNADEKLLKAQKQLADLEKLKAVADDRARNLEKKLESLRAKYDVRLAEEAAAAQAALGEAQVDLQKARDVCAADLGAAAEAKQQVDALLATAQGEAQQCALRQQSRQAVTAAPEKPGINPAVLLVGGAIAGFALSKVRR